MAKAVAEWQAKKEAGTLSLDKKQEENIYITRPLKVGYNCYDLVLFIFLHYFPS